MSYYENGSLSPSDVALIQGRNGGASNMNNGDGAWWIILFLIFALGGWGRNNGGFGGGSNGGDTDNMYPWLANGQNEIMQNMNNGFNTLELGNQLNGINNQVQGLSTQLCNCCADVNSNLCNGFAGVNQTVNAGFANAETAANARQMADMQQNFNNQIATLQGFNSMSSQFANCCCENRLGIERLNATILAENCADREALSNGIRDLMASSTANTQAILDKLCQQEIDAKNDTIANLRTQVNMQTLAASQASQTNDIVNAVRPCPIPSYLTCSPYQSIPVQYVAASNGCGCNSGCNGNNNLF